MEDEQVSVSHDNWGYTTFKCLADGYPGAGFFRMGTELQVRRVKTRSLDEVQIEIIVTTTGRDGLVRSAVSGLTLTPAQADELAHALKHPSVR